MQMMTFLLIALLVDRTTLSRGLRDVKSGAGGGNKEEDAKMSDVMDRAGTAAEVKN